MKKRSGWIVLEDDTLKPMEFWEDEQGPITEPPYSNDGGVLQFHLEIEFPDDPNQYPTAKVIL
jgi:hypothetical protein